MSVSDALWSSTLKYCRIESEDPTRLAAFYEDALQMAPEPLAEARIRLSAPGRTLIIGPGPNESVPEVGFDAGGHNRLGALREAIEATGVAIRGSDSAAFDRDAFEVSDPEGLRIVFGCSDIPDSALPETSAPDRGATLWGRLQHVVFASPRLREVADFYKRKLGFVLSDTVVREDDEVETAVFVRSDPEHHSFACFRAEAFRFDHLALETSGWTDIRDWADHFAEREIPIWWGPGRHGPGNNLFFMIRDPDGNRIEISAECEHMPRAMPPRTWPHTERTLNLWGAGWMRD